MLRYLLLLFFSFLSGSANISVILLHTKSDYLFHFSHKNIAFYCRPAAVTTIDQLLLKQELQPVCKDKAQKFIQKYPFSNKQYAYKLHIQQKYFLLGLKKDCFIMLDAGTSFSEHLLEEGFAKLQNGLGDKFLNSTLYKKLKRSQDRAEYHKRGIWEDPILANCF